MIELWIQIQELAQSIYQFYYNDSGMRILGYNTEDENVARINDEDIQMAWLYDMKPRRELGKAIYQNWVTRSNSEL